MANILKFLKKKKKDLKTVIDSKLDNDESAVFIGEGTTEEYEQQLVADKGLKGIFGLWPAHTKLW